MSEILVAALAALWMSAGSATWEKMPNGGPIKLQFDCIGPWKEKLKTEMYINGKLVWKSDKEVNLCDLIEKGFK